MVTSCWLKMLDLVRTVMDMSKKNKKREVDLLVEGKPASLFVGRYQPFHDGHKKLVETVLKEGKPAVIAIRDTEISKKNPYTVTERWTMIQQALKRYSHLVRIVAIPDIDEVCYGREVGYLIRRIDLDGKTERISATAIRSKGKLDNPIIWLTGQCGSGKTTLAKALEKNIDGIILDGDEMRRSISLNAGFSAEDREEHNLRVARLAGVLARKRPVIVSVIAPFAKTRAKITKLIDPVWIYVKRKLPKEKHKPYEPPKNTNLVIDVDRGTVEENIAKLTTYVKEKILKQ